MKAGATSAGSVMLADAAVLPRDDVPALPSLSVVIPVLNEAGSVTALTHDIFRTLTGLDAFEVIFVDDGSSDGTADVIAGLRHSHPRLRLLRHDRRCGQSAALVTGVRAALADWVVTLDGDGQDDPAAILPMLRMAQSCALRSGAAAITCGIRAARRDGWSRRAASRAANAIRQAVLRDGCPDAACGLKAFRRDAFLRLPAFDGMHRYLPALFQSHGHAVLHCPVQHRPRRHGRSKYTNLGRALIGVPDLLGVAWLLRRTRIPRRVMED
jgi:dolichol-phosphate mannosyltransferase